MIYTLHFWICLKNIQDSMIIWHKHNKNVFIQKLQPNDGANRRRMWSPWFVSTEICCQTPVGLVAYWMHMMHCPTKCFPVFLCSGVRQLSPCAIHFSGCVESLKYLAFSNGHSVLADGAGLGPRWWWWWWWVIGSSCWNKWNLFTKTAPCILTSILALSLNVFYMPY